MIQVVEHLPCMLKALSSNPRTAPSKNPTKKQTQKPHAVFLPPSKLLDITINVF
jgi:hypothetical protein